MLGKDSSNRKVQRSFAPLAAPGSPADKSQLVWGASLPFKWKIACCKFKILCIARNPALVILQIAPIGTYGP
jgi:hypothetical protein